MYIKIGKKYGLLTVLEEVGKTSHYEHLYKCECECGEVIIRKDSIIQKTIKNGYIPSCGCGRKKLKK